MAVRPDCDPEPVRRFECFTADLHRLANWLQSCGVKTVAMQSTGVYWIPLRTRFRGLSGQRAAHQEPARTQERCAGKPVATKTTHLRIVEQFVPTSFEDSGLAHLLAATRATREWSGDLHSTNAESADADEHTISECDQRSERSDWTDDRTIVGGERDPRKLAELSHPRIQARRGQIAESLEGNWRQELIFVLQQEIEMYDTYQRRISECDQQLQKHLAAFADTVPPPAKEELPPKKKGKRNKNNPHFHLADELQRITGVDLTRIDGVDVMVAQTLVSEVGLDMSRWKTEAHFASWLGLCPDNRISGDKVLARGTRHVVNRAATALRMGASTLLRSQTYLGAQYRRLRSKLGAPKAVTTMAHGLTRLVYRMLKYCQQYADKGAEYY